MVISIISGLVIGLLLGWSLQRGGFCMNTAFRSIIFREYRSILRAWILVLVINLPAVTFLDTVGILYPSRAPFTPLSLVIGGLLFGAGMVWAGGCVSGSGYRASKGMIGSLLAFLGFAAGAMATRSGALSPLRTSLSGPEWTIYGDIPSLGHLLPFNPWIGRWIAVALLVVPGIIFLLKSPPSRFAVGWKWPRTGTAIGILAWRPGESGSCRAAVTDSAGPPGCSWLFLPVRFSRYGEERTFVSVFPNPGAPSPNSVVDLPWTSGLHWPAAATSDIR